jgi:hypothetical protein
VGKSFEHIELEL